MTSAETFKYKETHQIHLYEKVIKALAILEDVASKWKTKVVNANFTKAVQNELNKQGLDGIGFSLGQQDYGKRFKFFVSMQERWCKEASCYADHSADYTLYHDEGLYYLTTTADKSRLDMDNLRKAIEKMRKEYTDDINEAKDCIDHYDLYDKERKDAIKEFETRLHRIPYKMRPTYRIDPLPN